MAFASTILSLALLLPFTMADFEAAAYLDQIERRVMDVWRPPANAGGLKVILRFNLARNGRLSNVRVDKSSGNATFDNSAIQAVRRASPFPRPPKSFPVGDLRIVLDQATPDHRDKRRTGVGQEI